MKGSSVPHASIISEQAEQDTSDPLAGLGKWVSRCEQGVVYVSEQLRRCEVGSQLIAVITVLNLVPGQPPEQLKMVRELLQRERSGGPGVEVLPLKPREVRDAQEPGVLSRRK